MKLYFAPNSPYARKVRILAAELGQLDAIEHIFQMPRDNSTGFWDVNPLGRVPTLITDEGTPLYDSPVICDYINTVFGGAFIPNSGARRWEVLRRMALGDGMLDAAIPLRTELLMEKALQAGEVIERHDAALRRVLASLENETLDAEALDIGSIAIACAIAWIEFRIPSFSWRSQAPNVAQWFDRLSQRPTFQATKPS
jgi:glutathione S-transferase